MDDPAEARTVPSPNPPKSTTPPRRPRGRLITLGSLGLAVVTLIVVFGSYHARRTLADGQNVCVVTTESLSHAGNSYGGGDHPLDPQAGDHYVGTSGCNTFETQCTRQIKILGSRLDCSTAPS